MSRFLYSLLHRVAWSLRAVTYPFTTADFRHRMQARMASKMHAAAPVPQAVAGVNVVGSPHSPSGVGTACQALMDALAEAEVACAPIDARLVAEGCSALPYEDTPRFPVSIVHVNAGEMDIVRRVAPVRACLEGRAIGYWYWELPEFPVAWMHAFEGLDELWVASSYTQKALSQVSPIPVVHIAPPVSLPETTVPIDLQALGVPAGAFVFLCMADALSAVERKNPQGALEAYRRAFADRGENVCMIVKLRNASGASAEAMSELRDGLEVPVVLLEQDMSRAELFGLYEAVDGFVSLHRAEGFGLPLVEAMHAGTPCVCTGWSGNMDFTDAFNSYLVDYRLVQLEQTLGVYASGQTWAEPDLDHAAQRLRELVSDPEGARVRGARASRDVRARYGVEAAGARIAARLARFGSAAETDAHS